MSLNYPMNVDGEYQAELEVTFENGNKGAKMFYGDSMDEVQNFAYLDLKDIIWEGNIDPFGDMKVASFKISAKKA